LCHFRRQEPVLLDDQGLQLCREVLDIPGLGREREDFLEGGKEVVEGSHWRQGRA